MSGGDRLAIRQLFIVVRAIALTCGAGVVCLVIKSLRGRKDDQ